MLMQLIIKKIYIVFFLLFFTHISFANEIFVSLKKNKVNVRYGPSFESDVKYVYKKINLPLKQIDKKENFRRIIDLKNNSGWIHISQLKKSNIIIILKNKILFNRPTKYSKPLAKIEKAVMDFTQARTPLSPFVSATASTVELDKNYKGGHVWSLIAVKILIHNYSSYKCLSSIPTLSTDSTFFTKRSETMLKS